MLAKARARIQERERTRRETELRMFEIKVNDFGQRVHFGCPEVADELR